MKKTTLGAVILSAGLALGSTFLAKHNMGSNTNPEYPARESRLYMGFDPFINKDGKEDEINTLNLIKNRNGKIYNGVEVIMEDSRDLSKDLFYVPLGYDSLFYVIGSSEDSARYWIGMIRPEDTKKRDNLIFDACFEDSEKGILFNSDGLDTIIGSFGMYDPDMQHPKHFPKYEDIAPIDKFNDYLSDAKKDIKKKVPSEIYEKIFGEDYNPLDRI